MRAAFVSLCASLALCASPSLQVGANAPGMSPGHVGLNPSLPKNEKHPPIFTAELLQEVAAPIEKTPGDSAKFRELFTEDASDAQILAFSIAVQDSMIDVPVDGLSAKWRQELIDTPALCVVTELWCAHMFEFFQFLAYECNKAFVDTLLPILKPKIIERIQILAAVYDVARFMQKRFPHFQDSRLYSTIQSGSMLELINSGDFIILINFLQHAARTGGSSYLIKWFKRISDNEKIAFYLACGISHFEIQECIFALFPVSAAVFEALVLKADLEMTLMMRIILAHVTDPDTEVLKNLATKFYSEKKYEQYFRIALWLPTVDKLSIPNTKDNKKAYALALLNAKAKFLDPSKAKIVCDAFVALNELKMLDLFLWRYIQDNVYDKELDRALALVWEFERESLFTRVVFFVDESLGANAARHVAAAHRAAVLVTKKRIAVFAESLVALSGFRVADFEESLEKLLVDCSLADKESKSKKRAKQTQNIKFDASYVLQVVRDKYPKYVELHEALSKPAVIVCVTEPPRSRSNH